MPCTLLVTIAERTGGLRQGVGLFLGFDRIPAAGLSAENMGMAANQFVADGAGDGVHIEAALFAADLGMENYLQQQIPQFLLEVAVVAMANGIGHFMGLLEHVGHQRGVGLLQIPGTALIRIPQTGHHLDQLLQRIRPF